MNSLNLTAFFRQVEHELRRSKRRKKREGCYNRVHKRNILKKLKKTFDAEESKMRLEITNHYFEIRGQKYWFSDLQSALDKLYCINREQYLRASNPRDLIKTVKNQYNIDTTKTETQYIQGGFDMSALITEDYIWPKF